MAKQVILCKPNGFCAGVDRAIKIVDLALDAYGPPIYVNHEIVHNYHVVNRLSARGAVFLESLDDAPVGSRLIYSAHGVPPSLRAQAKARKLVELDATCPLVTKVHLEALKYVRQGCHIFLIGHANHIEVEGTYGEAPDHITIVEPESGEALDRAIANLPEPPTDNLRYLTQTTLNVNECYRVVDALKKRFPTLKAPPSEDICYATTNRQDAVKVVAKKVDFVVVVGANISSNSKRLVEVAREEGAEAALFHGVDELKDFDLSSYSKIGVTSGASTPDLLVNEVLDYLASLGFDDLATYDHVEETMEFNLPYEFRKDLESKGIPV